MSTAQIQRHDIRIALALFLLLTCFFMLTGSATIQTTDGETAYQTTEALGERGSFTLLDPEVAGDALRAARVTEGGYYGITGPLQSLLSVPFYLVGRWVAWVFPPVFSSYFTRFFVALTNSPLHAATVALLYLIGRDLGYRRRTALFVALTYGLATLAWPYSRTFFADTPLTFWLVLAAWGICRYMRTNRWQWMALVGSALGLGITNKYVMAFSLPAFALCLLLVGLQQSDWAARRNWTLRTLLAGGLPFLLIVLALVLFNSARFNHPLETGYTGGAPMASAVTRTQSATPLIALYGFFFSSGKGFFFFSPPTTLFLGGVLALARRRRIETYLFLSIAMLYPLVYSMTKVAWYGGATWGPRHILCITPFLTLFVGAFLERRDLPRWLRVSSATLLFVAGFWVQMSTVFVNYSIHLFSDTPFMHQIFYPSASTLTAQWRWWPRQVKAWQSYDHDLRASGAEFYLVEDGFYDVEVPEMAPFGRWMDERGGLRIYAQPEQSLVMRIAYSRPQKVDAASPGWAGLHAAYDGVVMQSERQLVMEDERESQWIEIFTIPAEDVQILPGTLQITATTWQPQGTDSRDLSIFIANVEVLKDGVPLPYKEAHLPQPLPVSRAYRWSWDAMFWFYNPANARPADVWPWYIWTSGLPLAQAQAFILVWGGALTSGLLLSGWHFSKVLQVTGSRRRAGK
ncbi:MAG: ArnT family glycosyltransferase [Anaerolineales bacterium]